MFYVSIVVPFREHRRILDFDTFALDKLGSFVGVKQFYYLSTIKTNTLALFEVFKKTMSDEDARLVVRYVEDANEAEIVKTVERKIEHLATKEDIYLLKKDMANLRAEFKEDIANTKAEIIKWMFIFWVAQLGAMFGFLHFFLNK